MSNGQKIDYNVLIDSKNVFHQSVKSDSNQNIRKILGKLVLAKKMVLLQDTSLNTLISWNNID